MAKTRATFALILGADGGPLALDASESSDDGGAAGGGDAGFAGLADGLAAAGFAAAAGAGVGIGIEGLETGALGAGVALVTGVTAGFVGAGIAAVVVAAGFAGAGVGVGAAAAAGVVGVVAAGFAAGAVALAARASSALAAVLELGALGAVGVERLSAGYCAVFPRNGEFEARAALVAFVPADEGAVGSVDETALTGAVFSDAGFAGALGALGVLVLAAGFAPGIGSGFDIVGALGDPPGAGAGAAFGGAAADGVFERESKRNIDVGFAPAPLAGADPLAAGLDALGDDAPGAGESAVLKIGAAAGFAGAAGVELDDDEAEPVLKIAAGAGFAAGDVGPSPGDVLLDGFGADPALKIGAGVGFDSLEEPSPGDVLLDPGGFAGVAGALLALVAAPVEAGALSVVVGLFSAVFAASSGDFGSVIARDS